MTKQSSIAPCTVCQGPVPKRSSRFALTIVLEASAYTVGLALIALSLAIVLRTELQRVEAAEKLPDMALWSDNAKARYLAAEADEAALLGVLRAPAVGLEVPVYDSDSKLKLDRGAGIIDGMAFPHEPGHIGIAGHRDGYFRALKDLALGDELELDTLQGRKHFIVDELRVIEPTELHYLQETEHQRLTIVTCYPFYFVGSAPQRYLVRAALTHPQGPTDSSVTGDRP